MIGPTLRRELVDFALYAAACSVVVAVLLLPFVAMIRSAA